MSSSVVPRGSEEWQHLEDVLKEVHDGKVYRRGELLRVVEVLEVAEVMAGVVAV